MPLEKNLEAGKPWQFDAAVAADFDDMLGRSIPDYEGMRAVVREAGDLLMAGHKTGAAVIDLGCSRGDALAHFVDRYGAYHRYAAVECSGPMADVAEGRFAGAIKAGLLRVYRRDLREFFPPELGAALVLSVLTLQFVPVTYRAGLLRRAYDALAPGGGLILVEKVTGSDEAADRLLTAAYHARKRAAGYTDDEVRRKALALEGVLVPLPAAENERALRAAGFRTVECVWRTLSFAGWVAVR